MKDTIYRQDAIDVFDCSIGGVPVESVKYVSEYANKMMSRINALSSAQPDNQTNLCDSCDYSYPDCSSKKDDVIFGNGKGNDNICACNKYKPSVQPEIIYCGECKHLLPNGRCLVFVDDNIRPSASDFCGRAERREE